MLYVLNKIEWIINISPTNELKMSTNLLKILYYKIFNIL